MSWVQSRGGKEGRRQRGEEDDEGEEEGLGSCCNRAKNQMIYHPSDKSSERHPDVPHRPDLSSGTRPKHLARESSLEWQEERRFPSPPNLSPGWQRERPLAPPRTSSPDWHEERPLADSDILPARWLNDQSVNRETRDANQEQPRRKAAKVHFQRPAERRQRIPEDDDDDQEEGESGSLSGKSLRASMAGLEKGGSKPDDRNSARSYWFDVIDREWDEDGFVHVSRASSRSSPCGSPRGSPRGSPCGRRP